MSNPITLSPHKQGTKRKQPHQPTNAGSIARTNEPSPAQPPKPQPQKKGSNCKNQKKRGTQCKKIATPKNKRACRNGVDPQRSTGAEVECL
jgi:hypothetical protein